MEHFSCGVRAWVKQDHFEKEEKKETMKERMKMSLPIPICSLLKERKL